MSESRLHEAEDNRPTKGQPCMREMWWRDNGRERKQYGEVEELQRHGYWGGLFLDKEHLCPTWCLVSLLQWFNMCEWVCAYGLAYYPDISGGKGTGYEL